MTRARQVPAGRRTMRARASATTPPTAGLLELLSDLVDTGLDARLVLVAPGRARRADPADGLVDDLDRTSALLGDDVAEMNQAEGGIVLQACDQIARGDAESARGVGLAHAVLHRMRAGVVATHLDENLAVAADHRYRHAEAVGLAARDRGFRDRQGHGGGEVLAL